MAGPPCGQCVRPVRVRESESRLRLGRPKAASRPRSASRFRIRARVEAPGGAEEVGGHCVWSCDLPCPGLSMSKCEGKKTGAVNFARRVGRKLCAAECDDGQHRLVRLCRGEDSVCRGARARGRFRKCLEKRPFRFSRSPQITLSARAPQDLQLLGKEMK